MHTGTRPFKTIQLTLTALLEGVWISHRVGGWLGGFALHRPGWENDNNRQIKKNSEMAGDVYT